MRTFFTLPLRESVGDVPLKPGFCMPSPPPPPPLVARGFFRLDLSGLRANTDDPFELSVVVIDAVLPFVGPRDRYGLPLASVIDMVVPPPPPSANAKHTYGVLCSLTYRSTLLCPAQPSGLDQGKR